MRKILILLLLFMTSCATVNTRTEEAIYNNISNDKDFYNKTDTICTPYYRQSIYSTKEKIGLSALLDNTGLSAKICKKSGFDITHGIYYLSLESSHFKWHFFSSARDYEGKSLRFTGIDRVISDYYNPQLGTLVHEYFNVYIPNKSYLDKRKDKGLDIKIYGKRWSVNLKLPSRFIKALLKKIN